MYSMCRATDNDTIHHQCSISLAILLNMMAADTQYQFRSPYERANLILVAIAGNCGSRLRACGREFIHEQPKAGLTWANLALQGARAVLGAQCSCRHCILEELNMASQVGPWTGQPHRWWKILSRAHHHHDFRIMSMMKIIVDNDQHVGAEERIVINRTGQMPSSWLHG